MRKGFTIVELLAVVVILASIMLIIIPLVVNNVKTSEITMTSQTKDNIVLAAKNWAIDNKEKLPDSGEKVSVFVETLKDEGYLDSEIKDEFKDSCVIISNKNDVYYYKIPNNTATCGSASINKKYYTLTLNANGGVGNDQKLTCADNKDTSCKIFLPNNSFTRDGYTFNGFSTNKEDTSGLNPGTEVTLTNDVTYYATWKLAAPTCTLALAGNSNNGWYNSDVTVTMTTTGVKDEFGLATSEKSTNKKTSAVHNEDGTDISYYGYIKNSAGEDTCSITFKRDTTKPSCLLSLSGTLGSNGWYKSNVGVQLSSKTDTTSGVDSYGMGTTTSASYNSTTSLTQTNDTAGVTYFGYVKDNAGNVSSCSATVKKDTAAPRLSNSQGSYNSYGCITFRGTTNAAMHRYYIRFNDSVSGISETNYAYKYADGNWDTSSWNENGLYQLRTNTVVRTRNADGSYNDIRQDYNLLDTSTAYFKFRVYDTAGNYAVFNSSESTTDSKYTAEAVSYSMDYNNKYCRNLYPAYPQTPMPKCSGNATLCYIVDDYD